MGDRIMIIGPDGRRNYVQAVHCTTDNLRMVYNMPGDLFLEAALPDGASELIFAERGRFAGLSGGVEYLVRGSAGNGGGGGRGGGGGGGSAVAQSRSAQAQRAVAFKDVPVTAPVQPAAWEAAAQAAAATPWDPAPAPAPQQQPQQRAPRQKQPPGNFAPSSAEVEAARKQVSTRSPETSEQPSSFAIAVSAKSGNTATRSAQVAAFQVAYCAAPPPPGDSLRRRARCRSAGSAGGRAVRTSPEAMPAFAK